MPAMPGDARRDSKARMKNDITLNKKKICKEGRHFRAMTCDAQPYEAVKKREMPGDARKDTQRCDAQRCAAMPRDATKDALGKIGSDASDARRCKERWLSKNEKQYNPVKKNDLQEAPAIPGDDLRCAAMRA